MLLPREHGAWSILAQPFLCALILAGTWHASIPAAGVAVLAMFLLRTPLVILGRQALVWREAHPECRAAWRWSLIYAGIAALTVPLLSGRWGWRAILLFGGAAIVLTALAVYMEVTNRQRSVWLQLLTAAGLSSSCLAAALSATGTVPVWCWVLWVMCAAHAGAGILVVRARLEVRIAARSSRSVPLLFLGPAQYAQTALLIAGTALMFYGSPWIAAALILPSLIHLYELRRLAATIDTPLHIVGLRALTISVAFSILALCGLWTG
jgi:hypothetical protein